MRKPLVGLILATIILGSIAYVIGGLSLVFAGFTAAFSRGYEVLLLLITAFIVLGQLQVLLSEEIIARWLSKFSGAGGIVLSAFAGGVFPGGPYIYYPFLRNFRDKVPSYIFMSIITGKHVYDFTRFPMEFSLISPGIAVLRYIITLPVPILAGLICYYFPSLKKMLEDSAREEY